MRTLLASAQSGDREAFEKLLAGYEGDIYRMAYVHVKNKQDALDVAQETAYRAFRGLKSLKDPDSFRAWLMRITVNCAVDHMRRKRREISMPQEDMEGCAEEPSYEESLTDRLTLEQLMNVLNTDEKQIIMLKYYCECTFAEIARDTERPVGTVKTILYRALAKLRKTAEEEDLK